MKRLIKLLVVLGTVIFAETANACNVIQLWAERGGQNVMTGPMRSSTKVQKSYSGATVNVYQINTLTPALIYSNSACSTPKSQGFSAGDAGFVKFYTNEANVDVAFSGSGVDPYTLQWSAMPVGSTGVFAPLVTVTSAGSAFPATSGVTQSAGQFLRLKDASDLTLDMGGNAANGAWLQSTNSTNLAINYPLLLNPNGGQVAIGTTSPDAQTALHVRNTTGGAAIGGDYYNHVMLAVGFNGDLNTSQLHQVGVYSALRTNSSANGVGSFNAGFETAIGTKPGAYTVERIANYAVGSLSKGAGTTIQQSVGLLALDETAGTNNAAITVDADSLTFTGNWFIHYGGTRQSKLGGNLLLGGDLTFSGDTEIQNDIATSFVRLRGGTSASPGATFLAFGPTHATNANEAQITGSGGVVLTGGDIKIGGSGEIYRTSNTGFTRVMGGTSGAGASLLLFSGAHATNANQADITASGGLTLSGGNITYGGTGEHYRTVSTGYNRFFGGTVASPGGAVLMFGGTHATDPNEVHISASGGLTVSGNTLLNNTLTVTGTTQASTLGVGLVPTWPFHVNVTSAVVGALVTGANDFTAALVAGKHAGTTGFGSAVTLQNEITSGTQTSLSGLTIFNPTGAGALTNNAALHVRTQTKGTNNTAFLFGTDTVPTGNFGIYGASSNANFLTGLLSVGETGSSKLNVFSDNGSLLNATISDTRAFAANVGGLLIFDGKYNSGGSYAGGFARIAGLKENATDGNFAGYLSLYSRVNGGAMTEGLRIDSSQKVHLGSASSAGISRVWTGTASLNFTALAAQACETLTITVTGAVDGDEVSLGVPNALADVDGATERTTFFGWVSAADTVSVRRCNPTAGATADPAAATVRASVIQY